jgi:hypothetical protein
MFNGTIRPRKIQPKLSANIAIPVTGGYNCPWTHFGGDVMSVCMAERIRMIIDTDKAIRLAVRLEATKTNKSPSQIINDILRRELADMNEQAGRYLPPDDDDDDAPPEPPRRGRPRKSTD